ncbi:MAG: aromatic ring-hydroxylating dioxygenase subunit alpha [Gammaproteobacteria bacterium]|nr:aromatic ring-hydroxylating dioxygenase subunit alpha [Gammaproteobacteria bacterium]
MKNLLPNDQLIEKILDHIDNKTTDLGTEVLRVPTVNYVNQNRFDAEIALIKRSPVPFCPIAMLADKGSYVARKAAGTPIVVVRGMDGEIRAFINACRHRGMPVASETGCTRAFVCPYHAWSYGLDGKLLGIAGSHGFPGVDPEEHGLIQISAKAKGGLVFIQQEGSIGENDLDEIPDFFSSRQEFVEQDCLPDETNWKLIAETTMEGYHIKRLHNKSFYPYGLDNINVVENFGPNSRVIFPFKRINDLREIKPEERDINGYVTAVYNLFPNSVVSILSKHSTLTIFEPVSPTKTHILIYRVTNQLNDGSTISIEDAKVDADFVKGTGLDEDREAAVKIQETVNAGRNSHLTFGLFEKAIVHFHQNLDKRLIS